MESLAEHSDVLVALIAFLCLCLQAVLVYLVKEMRSDIRRHGDALGDTRARVLAVERVCAERHGHDINPAPQGV